MDVNYIKTFNDRIVAFKELIKNSSKIVFFGGAGVSTESGIPDFRSKNGLYNTPNVGFEEYSPEYLLSSDCLYNNPKVFFEFYRQKFNLKDVEPNITHKKLAELEKNKDLWIVTQNIDGLHQKAGSKNVLEIHGTSQKAFCRGCGKLFDAEYIFKSKDEIPHCDECGGDIRPLVTLYGEMLPPAFDKAKKVVNKADLLIIGGTSLAVQPAASLLDYFDETNIVLINNEPTPANKRASIVFTESLGEVFSRL